MRSLQSSAMSRLIARKGGPSSSRHISTVPRPYKFHIGASWAGKPAERGRKPLDTVPFTPDSPIGAWRDATLSRPKSVASKDAGEDFFYVQEVSFLCMIRSIYSCIWLSQMRNGSVRGLSKITLDAHYLRGLRVCLLGWQTEWADGLKVVWILRCSRRH